MDETATSRSAVITRDAMVEEARRIVDAARERGVVLRLYGGLAVRALCDVIAFCARDYSDFDLIGRQAQQGRDPPPLRRPRLRGEPPLHAGHARPAAAVRAPVPALATATTATAHPDDHVDVFLDTFKMDHEIDLESRLEPRRLHDPGQRPVAHQAPGPQAGREGRPRRAHAAQGPRACRGRGARRHRPRRTSPPCAPTTGACTTTSSAASTACGGHAARTTRSPEEDEERVRDGLAAAAPGPRGRAQVTELETARQGRRAPAVARRRRGAGRGPLTDRRARQRRPVRSPPCSTLRASP